MKLEFIQQAAKWWAMAQSTGNLPLAETTDQAKLLYQRTSDEAVVSTSQVERVIEQLKEVQVAIKQLEAQEDAAKTALQNYMKDKTSIITPYNETLVTWKASKASKSFDKDLFKSAMPDIYEQFVVEKPGSRRFLVK